MNDPYRKSTMPGGTLICLGGVIMVMCAYFYFDDVADRPGSGATMAWLAGIGYVLWVTGSVLVARARFSSLWTGLICGLLLAPGLIALLCFVPTLNRQEIWQKANPDFGTRSQERQYKNFKSLY